MRPTIGKIVVYKLTDIDAQNINRRRTTSFDISYRVSTNEWPLGAQAHIGTEVLSGEEFPMLVVRAHSTGFVNGQVFLDGNDVLWTQVVHEGNLPGQWHWPELSNTVQTPKTIRPNCF